MSSIVQVKVGSHTYLYESKSYRDNQGNPRNKRVPVGKRDPKTGKEVYKPEFLERIASTKEYPEILAKVSEPDTFFSIDDIRGSTIKEYGVYYLFECIANEIGLTQILMKTFPNQWTQIFNLASFIVATGEPSLYCEDWLNKTENYSEGSMSSQRISELLISISNEDRLKFYEQWGAHRSEQEYLALDITSISSYSELISDVEWGYNRDKEKLPQINLCMLLGEKSRLPVYQTVYSGSLKDVSTLKTTLELATSLSLENVTVVMDKGFCSVNNVNSLLRNKQGLKFLLAVPFAIGFAKRQVENEKAHIDHFDNTIIVGDDILRGVTRDTEWDKNHNVFAHVFCNTVKASCVKNRLFHQLSILKEEAIANPVNKKLADDFKKYLSISETDEGCQIDICQDAVDKELAYAGWLVLISNSVSNAKDAIEIYRAKDVVEKGFLQLKNSLDLARLRTHSDESMQNKIFVGFIALIVMAYVHRIMHDSGLYRSMTMKKLFKSLEKLRVQYINDNRILFPLTKEQSLIFNAFGFDFPV